MPSIIPTLWSDDIKVDLVSPLAILRAQAGPLRQMTQGILESEVTTITGDTEKVRHQFDLIAPLLNGYRYRILTVTGELRETIYPVVVEADCFVSKDENWRPPEMPANQTVPGGFFKVGDQYQNARGEVLPYKTMAERYPEYWRKTANTQEEFIELIRDVLRSGDVRSVIQSLIVRSNEKRNLSPAPSEDQNEVLPSS